MATDTDMRIPIVMGLEPAATDAVLVEAGGIMPAVGHVVEFTVAKAGHPLACACCTLRGPVADALSRVFRERATGAAPFFKRVVVLASANGEAAVRQALVQDVVTSARYRI
jgi:hypothetical protein